MASQTNIPLERTITTAIMKYLKGLPDCWAFKEHGGSMSTAGVPDIIVCFRGIFVALEVKRPVLGRVTALQARAIEQITAAGGVAAVVRSVDEVKAIIAAMERGEYENAFA